MAAKGAALRTQADHSIDPVWAANHVWLIYVLVIVLCGGESGFPGSPDASRHWGVTAV